jgi:quinol monooxygenase YgiN
MITLPIVLLMSATPTTPPRCCPIVELRQYTLRPGQRDVLVELFERAFIETQEADGMRILGQFRSLDDPDRFVWLRGFEDMPGRARSLAAFYGGPAWKAHSKEANATMVDTDNVLLLHPARAASGFSLDTLQRPPLGAPEAPKGLVVATIYSFEADPGSDFLDFFEAQVMPQLKDSGASVLGCFVTENSPNTFPSLPVREGEHVFVFFSSFPDAGSYDRHLAELTRSRRWTEGVFPGLRARLKHPPETLRLAPTPRSLLRR